MSADNWTVQMEEPYVDPQSTIPGQVFSEDQLPDPDVQREGDVDPELWKTAGLLYIEGQTTHYTATVLAEDVAPEAPAWATPPAPAKAARAKAAS